MEMSLSKMMFFRQKRGEFSVSLVEKFGFHIDLSIYHDLNNSKLNILKFQHM